MYKLFSFLREVLYGKGVISSTAINWELGEITLSIFAPGEEETLTEEIKQYCEQHSSLTFLS